MSAAKRSAFERIIGNRARIGVETQEEPRPVSVQLTVHKNGKSRTFVLSTRQLPITDELHEKKG